MIDRPTSDSNESRRIVFGILLSFRVSENGMLVKEILRGQGSTAYGCGSGNTVGLENVFDLGRVGDLKSATSSASDCDDPGQGG